MNKAFFASILIMFMGLMVPCAGQEQIERNGILIEFHKKDAEIAPLSMEILETAREEFKEHLPFGDKPIRVVISHSYTDFQKYTGRFSQVSVGGIAKPSQGLIVVKSPRIIASHNDYPGTLRHELVHILLERNTDTGALPKWLNEGICMSLANEYHWESMFTIARMYTMGRIQEYDSLDRNLLHPGDEMSFGDTYAQGLSMTRFLRDRLGEDRFWAVVLGVRDLSFPDSLKKHGGISLEEFWQAYHNSLWMTAVLGSFGSGTLFIPASFLVVIAWFRQRRVNKAVIEEWTRQEEEEGDTIASLDELAEGEYEWEVEDDEEEENW